MKYPSGLYIIAVLIIVVISLLTLYYYANKLIGNTNLYIVSNILLISLAINFLIIFMLMLTYNKVKFTPGIRGPKGIRGEDGIRGKDIQVEQCDKQNRNMGETYIKVEKENHIRIQKPVMYNN
jgi:hypothetical protein